MSLNRVLSEIKKVKPLADEDLDNSGTETLTGRRGRKRNAQEQMKLLKEQYIDELRSSAAFILVTGSAKEAFQDVAKNEFKCFTANPEDFYEELAQRIPPALYENKSAVSNMFDVVGRHLEDKAIEMHIIGYPQLIFKQKYARTVKDRKEFVKLLKEAINDQVGSEITGIHTLRALADEAIEAQHDGKITPIVLATDDEKLALDLHSSLNRLGSRTFLVVAGKGSKSVKSQEGTFSVKEANAENVLNVLTNIRNLCK